MMTNFHQHIQLGRLAKKLRKSELARKIGITAQYMAVIEKDAIPSEDIIQKFIDVLELDEVETFKLADKLPPRITEKVKAKYYGGVKDERDFN